MRKRNIKKNFWLSWEENEILKRKAKRSGKSEADFVRCLITDIVLKEQPDERFYEVLKQLRMIGNNLNQIAHRANMDKGFIDHLKYQKEAEKWNQFILDVKHEFLGTKIK